MSVKNLTIERTIPSQFEPSIPVSTSDFVVSRRMREYVSDGQTEYSFNGTNVIKFTLNSADSFLDGRNSWIQFKLFGTVAARGGLSAEEGEQLARFLETGGGHSLFKRLRISLSNGTIISDYDYSQLYAIVRQHTMSSSHLEFQEGPSSFDGLYSSCSDGDKLNSDSLDMSVPAAELANATYTAATRTVAALNGAANLYRIGDEVIITSKLTKQTVIGKIETIPDANSFTLEAGLRANEGNLAATDITGIFRTSGFRTHRYLGAQGVSAGNHVLVKIKLFSDFFNNIKYLPLPFLRNLTIELTLNRDAHCVVFAKKSADPGALDFRWTIKDPVVVANLVTPSEELMNSYVDEYNSEQGIILHWIDYMSNKRTLELAASQSFTIPSNCHSALGIIAVQKLAECEAQTGNSWVLDTNGTHVKANLQEYQFQIGSEYFPFSRPVQCGTGAGSLTNGNAWNYVLQTIDSHGAKYECSSILQKEFYSVNSIARPVNVAGAAAGLVSESLKFVLGARFDRDGNYTGIDTGSNDIQINLSRSSAPSAAYTGYYLHSFVIHNRLMRISKASTVVFS